jgi:hypothetical protein
LSSTTGFLLDDDIRIVPAVEVDILINDGERHLAAECKTAMRQFPAKTFLVDRFEQPRTKLPVHLDAQPNDSVGQRWPGFIINLSLQALRPRRTLR